ncbi:aspartyl/asparaginyl beta-hydroxylase domain-containing protein [Lysobacter solisilvae (ex Woo and Kim 2020)]|uniref:Aspartyl/asparaginyl beta-hydroxylase domain-containing protein n=1 Tax=Agrilutibacter terrestris TaxID=2865112 RepID=A0A7H0FZR4_9GAMM|nr:aspartyl/asparaginyl beta-hydroxylase domain-containing protein [Lysobacter terrestris]QNP41530.1 aspartyl/asparaginyl beta-hydroxylase domain-containing protein [Lysobacter terrestris]
MKLPLPFIQLPLLFDAATLEAEINAIGESHWRPHPQGFPGNSMLPLVAVDGDPGNESFAGAMRPTEYLRRSPYLSQVFASIGATVGRSRLMRLAGQAEVTRHADQGYYWVERVRVHVPIVTQPTVRFECGGEVINMAPGECWIFDTWRQHSVLNDATLSRVHLVIDTVGGAGFWDLVGRGRPHNAPRAGWPTRQLAPVAGQSAAFPCETVNVPVVMSPWELNSHFGLLFGDVEPHPNVQPLRAATQRFTRAWQGLWFRYGERAEGHEDFRRLLSAYLGEIRPLAEKLRLNNELSWYKALNTIIVKMAVPAGPVAQAASARELGDNA